MTNANQYNSYCIVISTLYVHKFTEAIKLHNSIVAFITLSCELSIDTDLVNFSAKSGTK